MNNKIASIGLLVVSVFFFFLKEVGAAPGWFEDQDYRVQVTNHNNQKHYAKLHVQLKQRIEDSGRYALRIDGQGKYNQFPVATWQSEAELFTKDNLLFVQKSSTQVFVDQKQVLSSQKQYDYNQMKVFWINEGATSARQERFEFSIKGPICDDVTLIYVFDKIIPQVKDLTKFYLLTNEPKMYHVVIYDRGVKEIEVNQNNKILRKFQLMADLGPLTELAGKLVPSTFIWMDESSPDSWVRYEGMESGYKSAYLQVDRMD